MRQCPQQRHTARSARSAWPTRHELKHTPKRKHRCVVHLPVVNPSHLGAPHRSACQDDPPYPIPKPIPPHTPTPHLYPQDNRTPVRAATYVNHPCLQHPAITLMARALRRGASLPTCCAPSTPRGSKHTRQTRYPSRTAHGLARFRPTARCRLRLSCTLPQSRSRRYSTCPSRVVLCRAIHRRCRSRRQRFRRRRTACQRFMRTRSMSIDRSCVGGAA